MKIGLSFGRCVGSLVRKEVKRDEVLMVFSQTYMNTEEHVMSVLTTYRNDPRYLLGLDFNECTEEGLWLFKSGILFQHRQYKELSYFGIMTRELGRDDIWYDLVPSHTSGSDMAREAFDNYLMIRKLSE